MTNVKQAHQSFYVLKDNSRCLKDRRNVKREQDTKPTKRDSLGSEPFQRVDISRMRSPNIPFVGRGVNKQAVQQISIDRSDSPVQNEFSDVDRTSGNKIFKPLVFN